MYEGIWKGKNIPKVKEQEVGPNTVTIFPQILVFLETNACRPQYGADRRFSALLRTGNSHKCSHKYMCKMWRLKMTRFGRAKFTFK